ncbi:hypothetical protein EV700_0997 [Fluviicoccus keumensis]|uniref:SMI1/KNR4 family protein SUKH-1 n=1 Tax=Fluviicoccus keumensis TaxID=1435465 RepID=A0A4V2G6B7_9GAMM|nr:hypothetical protein [Fluviicoccus keumensis]RZU48026.1 hypothetical protein EV700_0997 [Fluviicoccus keumensis]
MMEVLARLSDIAEQGIEDVYLNDPVSSELLEATKLQVLTGVGFPMPDEYATFLSVFDGVQIGNAIFLGTQELVPLTKDAGYEGCLVLGNSGNHTEYVYEEAVGCYRAINLGHRDEVLSSFDSFSDLLCVLIDRVVS